MLQVRGDVLIDDKPNITGSATPTWQQLLFDAPYNRHVAHLPRLSSWADWEERSPNDCEEFAE